MKTERRIAENYTVRVGDTTRTYGEAGELENVAVHVGIEEGVSVDTRLLIACLLSEFAGYVTASDMYATVKAAAEDYKAGGGPELAGSVGEFVQRLVDMLEEAAIDKKG